ncbi:hypothetical protein DK847_16670 [Aestuariivirga litoralis]|uniref:Uncharacterized protein n=1 Tax=Aestuariivirga litoralis TaxID=2650924 RepID=A0A2W2C6T1_9HYPH|nr:hypothetical protein [Aestuariivirga litoralis]PZF75853.1 hypothetical protein DK847_16670 [Aestuariivirga litoralis]
MKWIVAYLGIGILVLLGFLIDARLREPRRKQDGWNEMRALLLKGRQSWASRVVDSYLIPGLTALLVLAFWPAALVLALYMNRDQRKGSAQAEGELPAQFIVTREHLREALSPERIEMQEMVVDPLDAAPKVPFGFLNGGWQRLRREAQEGDQFWSFDAPWGRYGTATSRRVGYALVRDGKVVTWFVGSIVPLDNGYL